MIFKSSAHTDFEEVHVALSLRAAIFRCHTDHQLAYMLIFSIPGCNIVVEAEAKIHHHHLYFSSTGTVLTSSNIMCTTLTLVPL